MAASVMLQAVPLSSLSSTNRDVRSSTTAALS
nr:hypothetical protein RTCK_03939 [Rhizobium sp. TCK]